VTGLSRFAAVVLLLAALTGAGGRGCTGEAGTAATGGCPGRSHLANHHNGSVRVWLCATGQGVDRGDILVQVGKDTPIVNDARNLPWQHRLEFSDEEFLEFDVTLIDKLSGKGTVKCYIYTIDGKRLLDEGGPGAEAKCFLPPLKLPA
jgi:hypothetical protein